MSAAMPVTNSAHVIDNASARKPTSTDNPPAGIHVKSGCSKIRLGMSSATRPAVTMIATTNEAAVMRVATMPARGSPRRLPAARSSTKPARGRAGINQRMLSTSAPQVRQVVGGGPGLAPHDSHDDAEAHHDLGRRHHEHEEHDRLPGHVVEHGPERHEREVDRVEH